MAQSYTREAKTSLPTNTTDLGTGFSAGDYTGVSADDGDYVSLADNAAYGIFLFKDSNTNTTDDINATWVGSISYHASLQPVYLEAYNLNGAVWESKASNNTVGTGVDFTLSASITNNQSNYYSNNSTAFWRVYQSVPLDANLQFFENFPGHLLAVTNNPSTNTLSIHAVNIPLSLSFNNVLFLVSQGFSANFSQTFHFGLYSLNGSTLSLANSASGLYTSTSHALTQEWVSMVTSASQNITPGTWYFAFNYRSVNNANVSDRIFFNSSINPGNAIPGGFLMGRMTASTNAMPASLATSDLDKTGSDAIRQPYIVITA